MKTLFFILLLGISTFCKGASDSKVDTIPLLRTTIVNSKDLLFDQNRSDFSSMDRIWLLAKAIHPLSNVGIFGDTLVVRIIMPDWVHDSLTIHPDTSVWPRYVQSAFDGFSIYAFGKDSCKFKYVVIDAYINKDSNYLGLFATAMQEHRKYTLDEKFRKIIPLLRWSTYVTEAPVYKKKKSIVLYHEVDTATLYSDFISIGAFYQVSSTIINDWLQKANSKIRKSYAEVVSIFHNQEHLICYSRGEINDAISKKMYQLKYYETILRQTDKIVNNIPDLDEEYRFNNDSFPAVMAKIEKWYGLQVEYKTKISGDTFTAGIDRSTPIEDVIAMIKKRFKIHIIKKGNKLLVLP